MKKKDIQPPLKIDSVLKKCRRQLNHVRLSVSHEHHLKQKREEWRHIVVFGCECGYEHEVVILGEKPAAPGAVEVGHGWLVHDQHDNLVAVIPDEKPATPAPRVMPNSCDRRYLDGVTAGGLYRCTTDNVACEWHFGSNLSYTCPKLVKTAAMNAPAKKGDETKP